jgi:hypothetical protein
MRRTFRWPEIVSPTGNQVARAPREPRLRGQRTLFFREGRTAVISANDEPSYSPLFFLENHLHIFKTLQLQLQLHSGAAFSGREINLGPQQPIKDLSRARAQQTNPRLLVRYDRNCAGVPRQEGDTVHGVPGDDPHVGAQGPAAGARQQGSRRDPGRAAARRHGQERRQAGAEDKRRRGAGAHAAARRRILRRAHAPAGRPAGQAEGVNPLPESPQGARLEVSLSPPRSQSHSHGCQELRIWSQPPSARELLMCVSSHELTKFKKN